MPLRETLEDMGKRLGETGSWAYLIIVLGRLCGYKSSQRTYDWPRLENKAAHVKHSGEDHGFCGTRKAPLQSLGSQGCLQRRTVLEEGKKRV